MKKKTLFLQFLRVPTKYHKLNKTRNKTEKVKFSPKESMQIQALASKT